MTASAPSTSAATALSELQRMAACAASGIPRRRVAHLLVVLREVRLHPCKVLLRQVNATPRALHDVARGHDPAWHRLQLATDDIADQQFVRREVVLAVGVVPDVRTAVLRIRSVFGTCPLP